MKVNGSITIVEGGVVHNLTLPSSAVFPANGNRGELFSIAANSDPATWPDGLYFHDGTVWRNIPNLAEVKTLINNALGGGAGTAYFRPMLRVSTLIGALGIGTYWAVPNAGALIVTTPLTSPLNLIYLDPADFPTGTKLRLRASYSQNNTASAAIDFTVGLRKVGKPSTTGGSSQQMIYQADATDVASVVVSGGIASKAMGRVSTAEFDIPVAGFYTFVITLSNSNNGSGTHWDLVLQAKY